MQVLVTGASGYIGGRLIPLLIEEGHDVRIVARHPEDLRQRDWFDDVDVRPGDLGQASDAAAALEGVDVAYYLVHSMTAGTDFEERDRHLAATFGAASAAAGVSRIVYLGGLVPGGQTELSPHLHSRREVGEILRASGVPTIELRAAVIIGSGSASFEMLRYLTERLPVMITPRWVRTRTQPIAVRDVLYYLVLAATVPGQVNRAYDIGGPDVLTYQSMMTQFAEVAGLPPRRILAVNVLSPSLSSHWVGLVTPVPRGIARPLVESLRVEVVCRDHAVADIIPDPELGLLTYRRAVQLALRRIQDAEVTTRWSGASVRGAPSDPLPSDPTWTGGTLYTDVRDLHVRVPPERMWSVIEGVGGDRGYFAGDWMWEVRGALDRAVGGVGRRRGRRDPDHTSVGEALDFWRVEERLPPHLLRLRAEMRLPGLAWLEWRVTGTPTGCDVRQRAVFHPRGLAGHLYWWSMAPFHAFVFKPMLERMVAAAELPVAPTAARPGTQDAAPVAVTSGPRTSQGTMAP